MVEFKSDPTPKSESPFSLENKSLAAFLALGSLSQEALMSVGGGWLDRHIMDLALEVSARIRRRYGVPLSRLHGGRTHEDEALDTAFEFWKAQQCNDATHPIALLWTIAQRVFLKGYRRRSNVQLAWDVEGAATYTADELETLSDDERNGLGTFLEGRLAEVYHIITRGQPCCDSFVARALGISRGAVRKAIGRIRDIALSGCYEVRRGDDEQQQFDHDGLLWLGIDSEGFSDESMRIRRVDLIGHAARWGNRCVRTAYDLLESGLTSFVTGVSSDSLVGRWRECPDCDAWHKLRLGTSLFRTIGHDQLTFEALTWQASVELAAEYFVDARASAVEALRMVERCPPVPQGSYVNEQVSICRGIIPIADAEIENQVIEDYFD